MLWRAYPIGTMPKREQVRPAAELFERVEQFTERFMDVCAEERRMLQTLDRLRRVKGQLVAELATCAAEATEASIRERLADVSK
jgi:hypothetical protein